MLETIPIKACVSRAFFRNVPTRNTPRMGPLMREAMERTVLSAGLAVVLYVAFATKIAWPWYTLIGSMTTFMIGAVVSLFEEKSAK